MRFKHTLLLTCMCPLFLGCSLTKSTVAPLNELSPSALQPYGRHQLIDAKELELISSAVHFGFSFEGQEAEVIASIPNAEGHSYLQYELDGKYQKRIKITGGAPDTLRIVAQSAGPHTAWVYKATEAHTGPVHIQKVRGHQLSPIKKPATPIIEFIGNSITCGAAADPAEVPCGTGQYHDQHNAYMAYGPRVARALKAQFVLSCVSGIGAYRNWNSDGPTMPEVYEKADFQANSHTRWDFNTYTPAVVSIALGTNDFSMGDGKKERQPFDSTRFVNSYIDFVKLVKSKYPDARIALLSSAMVQGANRTLLQSTLLAVKAATDAAYPADKPVALHFFEPMQARGCSGHPNVEDHAILAQELVPFFSELLSQ
ncbi:SGNH/GDSL hydrolase family protein [Pontibacter sp. CAU 1760]